MKALYLFLWCMSAHLFLQAQETLPVDSKGKITYAESVSVSGTGKDALFARAQKFATGKYKFTAIKKAEGTLSFTGFFGVQYPGATSGLTDKGTVEFTVTITCKNGKYDYTFTDFRHLGDKGKGNGGKLEAAMPECGKLVLPKAGWDKIKNDTPAGVEKFKEQLKKAMEGK